MQDFEWKFLYNGIFMVWVAGYLSNSSLVAFLKRAKIQLDSSGGPSRRSKTPKSFIFLFDNILDEGEEKDPDKGQRFRTEKQFKAIFVEAGLIIHDQSEPATMPDDFMNVKVWVLY